MANLATIVPKALQVASFSVILLFLQAGALHPHAATASTQESVTLYPTNGPGGGQGYGLAIHPQNPDVAYVSGYKTVDGGNQWYRLNVTEVSGVRDMAIDPDQPNTVFLANVNTGSVLKTEDGGQSWTEVLSTPVNTHLFALAIDPQDTQTVYVGGESQLYKSEDGGDTWTDLLAGSGLEILINKIEINPSNTDEIYLGSGSWYHISETDRYFNCPSNRGIYRSRDGGQTWEHLDNQMRDALVSDIDIAPSNTSVIYAVSQDQHYNCTGTFANQDVSIYKSIDGGNTWFKVLDGGNSHIYNAMNHVAIDPTDEDIVYTVAAERVLKSTDGGENWTTITQPDIEPVRYSHSLEVAPSNPNIIGIVGYYRPFIRSEDGGQTWEVLVYGLTLSTVPALKINPEDSDHVIAGNTDGTVNITRDGGLHWERRFFGLQTQYPYGFTFHPYDYNTVYLGVSCAHDPGGLIGCAREDYGSGVWISRDGGETWEKSYEGLQGDQEYFDPESCGAPDSTCALQVYDLQLDPTNPDTIYAGTTANGVFKSQDGGQTWTESNNGIPKEFVYVRRDIPLESQEECRAQGYPPPSSGLDCARYASLTTMRLRINPHNSQEIWYTALSGVWKSENGGESWNWVSDVFKGIHVHFIAFDPEDPDIIYLGSHRSAITENDVEIDSNHGLYVSRDGGATWSQVGSGGPGEGYSVRSIAVDESNNVFVGTLEGELFISHDKGHTWTTARFDSASGVPAIDWLDISSDGVIYAGTRGAGVWRGIIGDQSGSGGAFRVTRGGEVFAAGTFNPGGADIAELINTSEPVEPGDVVAIDPKHPEQYRKTRRAYSPLAAGVISTEPGVILGSREPFAKAAYRPTLRDLLSPGLPGASLSISLAHLLPAATGPGLIARLAHRLTQQRGNGSPLLALMGQVYVKATTENGPILVGDLLVSSSTPGYVMRCDRIERCAGAIMGKALTALEEGQGTIRMLVAR